MSRPLGSHEFKYLNNSMRPLLISSFWNIYHITRTWHIQFSSLLQRDEVYILSLMYFHISLTGHEFDDRQNIERLFWKFMQILRIFLLVLKESWHDYRTTGLKCKLCFSILSFQSNQKSVYQIYTSCCWWCRRVILGLSMRSKSQVLFLILQDSDRKKCVLSELWCENKNSSKCKLCCKMIKFDISI